MVRQGQNFSAYFERSVVRVHGGLYRVVLRTNVWVVVLRETWEACMVGQTVQENGMASTPRLAGGGRRRGKTRLVGGRIRR